MNRPNPDIDVAEIVRRVVAQLTRDEATVRSSIRLNDQVITLQTIQQLQSTDHNQSSDTLPTISIPTKAIITPAAKDEIRQRNLQFIREDPRGVSDIENQPHPLNRGALSSFDIIDRDNPQREHAVRDQLAKRLTQRVATGNRAAKSMIVLCNRPAYEVHEQTVRHGHVAVMITSLADIDRFAAELTPTCWVFDMKRLNLPAAVNAIARIAQMET